MFRDACRRIPACTTSEVQKPLKLKYLAFYVVKLIMHVKGAVILAFAARQLINRAPELQRGQSNASVGFPQDFYTHKL
jgi:hypothetical protein